jgi:hypothetical protein
MNETNLTKNNELAVILTEDSADARTGWGWSYVCPS